MFHIKVNAMVHSSTFKFLKSLSKNNNKEWFDENRKIYEAVKAEFSLFVTKLIAGVGVFDKAVQHVEAKNCTFRINRDIRFSNDKSPYKNNLGASISPGGKKSNIAGYYIHLQPGECFLAGGIWRPEAPVLHAIRQEIDYNGNKLVKILEDKNFKKYFGSLSDEDKLKTVPKGYDKENEFIELIKNKSFIAVHAFDEKKALLPHFLKYCTNVFKALYPLNSFLREACD